jgi:hypothetical protein
MVLVMVFENEKKHIKWQKQIKLLHILDIKVSNS